MRKEEIQGCCDECDGCKYACICDDFSLDYMEDSDFD